MRTGSHWILEIQREFATYEPGCLAWAIELGSIDAPNSLAAGSHRRKTSIDGGFCYGMPTVSYRESPA